MASTSTGNELSTQARLLNGLLQMLAACMGRMPAPNGPLADAEAWGQEFALNLVSSSLLSFLGCSLIELRCIVGPCYR